MTGSSQGIDIQELLTHAEWVRRLASRLVAHACQADDVVQETWMAALRRPPTHAGNPRGWLTRATTSAARQLGRSTDRRTSREQAVARAEATPSTADLAVRAGLQRDVVDHVLALDESLRAVVLLRFFEDLPPRRIAERLRVPVKTVNSRLQRALEKLRQRLEREHGAGGEWCRALVPLVGREVGLPTIGAPSWTDIGGWIVKANAKIGIVAALTLVGAYGVWRALPERAAEHVPTVERVVSSEPLAADFLEGTTGEREPVPARELASAPATVVAAVATPASTFRVRGRALNLAGAPLGGVEIVPVAAPSEGLAITAADGFFEVELRDGHQDLLQSPGTIALQVHDPDLVTLCQAHVTRTNRNREQLIVATTVVSLGGLVVDTAGAPIPGAVVSLSHQNEAFIGFPHALDMTAQATFRSTSDDEGRFRFERFPEGKGLRLHAAAEGFEFQQFHFEGSEPLVLRLTRRDAADEPAVEGFVLDAQRQPVEGATVRLADERTRSGPRGAFRLPLSWVEPTTPLCAAREGLLPALIPGFGRQVQPGPDGEYRSLGPVELVLGGPPLEIRGRVVGPEGEPCADWSVSVIDETVISQMRIPIETAEGLARPEPLRVVTDREGRFRLTGLFPRDYVVQAFDPESLFRTEGTVPAGAIDALLRAANEVRHDVRGFVRSPRGEPLADVRVTLCLDTTVTAFGSSFLERREIVTDAGGAFAFDEAPRESVYLRFRGESVIPTELRLPTEESGREYEAVVFRRCHFRIEPRDPAGPAQQVTFQDPRGHDLQVYRFSANGMSGYPFAPLEAGRSEVLSVSEEAVIALVKGRGAEAVAHRIALEPGVVNVLRF